jgi:predicted DNA-binding transcriptional regulator AlpA
MISREEACYQVAHGDVILLTFADLVRITTKSRSTLERWLQQGSFPQPMFVFGPKLKRWHPAQITEWLQSCVPPTFH